MTKKQPKEEMRVLKIQNKALIRANDEYKKRDSFIKGIKIESLDSLESLKVLPNLSSKEEVIAISLLSDVHVEEEVVKSVVSGLNEYNLKIAEQRVNNYFKRLLYLVRQARKAGYKINKLVLGLMGDFISGYIHEELEENNLLTPTQATLFVQRLLVAGIKMLSENGKFDEIIIPCIPGNHARTTTRKRFQSGFKNSYESMMYYQMQTLFDENRNHGNVRFILPESEFIYLDLFGYVNLFSHGDQFRYQGGIGGIEVPLKKFILRENNVIESGIDMAWMAHWHQYIVSNKVRVNGSVIGYNSYARSFGFAPEEPKMQFQLLDKRRGFTMNNPILLNEF